MMSILNILALIVAPIITAIVLGLLQLAVYRVLASLGWVKRETMPPFPFLFLRGLVFVVAAAAILAIIQHLSGNAPH